MKGKILKGMGIVLVLLFLGGGSLLAGPRDVKFSPDARFLVVGTDLGIELWTPDGHRFLRRYFTDSPVVFLRFSADGRVLATLLEDGTTLIWDMTSEHLVKRITSPVAVSTERFVAFDLSPSGKLVAMSFSGQAVGLWDVSTGTLVRTLAGHSDKVTCVSFSPDEKTLATASMDKTVKLWDSTSGKELRTIIGHGKAVNCVMFSPDGSIVASASGDGIILWNTRTGEKLKKITSLDIESFVFSPTGGILVAKERWGTSLSLYHIDAECFGILRAHGGSIDSFCFHPSGRVLASCSRYDNTVKLWDMAIGEEICTLVGHSDRVLSVDFSPDGKLLASGSADGEIKLWDIGNQTEMRSLRGHSGLINSLDFSPSGKLLASGSSDQTVKLWDIKNGVSIWTLTGHTDTVSCVAFSPDGKVLASGSWDGTVKLWDPQRGSLIYTLSLGEPVSALAFSSNGEILGAGSWIGNLKLWEISSGREIQGLFSDDFDVPVAPITVVPSYWWFAESGTFYGLLTSWSTGLGKALTAERLADRALIYIGSVGKGVLRILVIGSWDGAIYIWDRWKTGKIWHLAGHTWYISSMSISPDEKILATGSWDKTVKLWDIGIGEILCVIKY